MQRIIHCCSFRLIGSFLFFLGLFIVDLSAQDLHVYYDAQNASIRYEFDGKTVKRPKVRKDANIFLHVENYNNYLYELELQTANQTIKIPSGSGVTSMLGVVGGNPMDLLSPGNFNSGAAEEERSLIDSGMVDLDAVLNADGSGNVSRPTSYDTENRVVQSAEAKEAMKTMEDMAELEKTFVNIEQDIEVVAERKEIRAIVMDEVQKIKYNDNLPPDQIKRISMEFLGNVLDPEEEGVKLKLNEVISKGSDRPYLKGKLLELESAKKEYLRLVDELKETGIQLEQLGSADGNIKALSAVITVNTKVPVVLESVENEVETIKNLYQEAGTSEIRNITSIWYEYEALASNSFSHTYRADAMGDRTDLNVQFYKIDTSGNRLPTSKQDPIQIKVPVYGGLKVNVSVGINFGQFFETPQDYFLKDTIVTSEDSNAFIPMATSFIHFYPQRVNDVSLGGSFGVGVPLGGDDNVSSLNFFLGPSLIFGKSKRVILNAGLMGGRVRGISEGIEVGDVVPPFSAIPTKAKYRMGYYLGVSFNI